MRWLLMILLLTSPALASAEEGGWRAMEEELERAEDFRWDPHACEAPALVSDVLKDAASLFKVGLTELSAPLFDDAAERALSEEIYLAVLPELPPMNAPDTEAYLNDLFAQITASHASRDLDWQVHLYESTVPNAYALAGGHVFVSSGMMGIITNEAQLVGILAHELGHHELRHTVAHLQYLNLLGLWSPEDSSMIAGGLLNLMSLPLASNQEHASDAFALEVLYDLGYSPYQMARLMVAFDFWYAPPRVDFGMSFAGALLPEVWNAIEDHPRSQVRACRIQEDFEARGLGDTAFYVGRINYKTRTVRR